MVDILQWVVLILHAIVLLSLNKRVYHLALDVIDLKFPKNDVYCQGDGNLKEGE